MSVKRKTSTKRENWQIVRRRYTWHMRPPFNDEFDHSHWWKGKSEINPVAALYELARRHPLVGEARLRVCQTSWYKAQSGGGHSLSGSVLLQALTDLRQEPEAIRCLCLMGSKSWQSIDEKDRRLWSSAARKMKGVDCRNERESCYRLPSSNLEISMWPFDPPTPGFQILDKCLAPDSKGKQFAFSDNALEAEIARHAVGAHRQGFVLIAVAPDLVKEKAETLLAKEYRQYQNVSGVRNQHPRSGDWPALIAAFEDEGAPPTEKKSQAFARYRNAMDLIHFASGPGAHVTIIPPK